MGSLALADDGDLLIRRGLDRDAGALAADVLVDVGDVVASMVTSTMATRLVLRSDFVPPAFEDLGEAVTVGPDHRVSRLGDHGGLGPGNPLREHRGVARRYGG